MLDLAHIGQFQERRGTHVHVFLWIVGRNRLTGLDESLGLWTGDDTQEFSVGGQLRTYFGSGTVLGVGEIRVAPGLDVRIHTVTLPPFRDEVRTALRVYEARGARCELHSWPFDLDTGAPLGPAVRIVRGTLQGAPETLGQRPEQSRVEIKIASSARALTRADPLLRSDAALRARYPGDRGREYIDTVGEWSVPWGET